MNYLLQLQNFSIQRANFCLATDINLTLNKGEICYLAGINGSGKSTLLMQLAGLLPIYSEDKEESEEKQAKILYQGKNGLPNKPVFISHQLGIHPNLTVRQNLQFLLNLYGISANKNELQQALSWVNLLGYEDITCNQLSAGQTRRVNLARLALMQVEHSPLWLLDEPFNALDSKMIDKLKKRLLEFVYSGGAVIITSHQAEYVVDIADKVLELGNG